MADNSCCSCVFSQYETNETDDGNYITCSKGIDITQEMLLETNCVVYRRGKIK